MAYIKSNFHWEPEQHYLKATVWLYEEQTRSCKNTVTLGIPNMKFWRDFGENIDMCGTYLCDLESWIRNYDPQAKIKVQIYLDAKTHCVVFEGYKAVHALDFINKERKAGKKYREIYKEFQMGVPFTDYVASVNAQFMKVWEDLEKEESENE